MQAGLRTRLTIHLILKELKTNNLSFDEVFEKKIKNQRYSLSDKKLIYSVVLNSMRNYIYAENIIKKFSKKKIKYDDSYYLLLSAITQLFILNYKDFAVVNSTVELTKSKMIKSHTKYINGILRTIIKNKDKLLKQKTSFEELPIWFRNKVSLTKKQKNDFSETIKEEPQTHIVFNNKSSLKNYNFGFLKTTNISAIYKKRSIIEDIQGYNNGEWWVQDLASMMPIYLLDKIENKQVADLCSAPGGKLFQLITKGAIVTSFEKNDNRVKLMKQNLQRLNLKCNIVIKDVLKIESKKLFDVVILDSPCSSLGTIRRNPEIFFRESKPNLKKITNIQKNLLNKASKLLKKNGILIYMVCSFLEDEGKNIVKEFLSLNKNFSLNKFSNKHKNVFIDKEGFYFVLPKKLKNNILIDGFFSAKIVKND